MIKTKCLLVFTSLLVVLVLAGCAPLPMNTQELDLAGTGLRGVVIMVSNNCLLPATNQNIGTKSATGESTIVYLVGNRGHQIQITADDNGFFEANGLTDPSYLVYANLGNAWLAKAATSLTQGQMNDIGELNPETTAQVVLYDITNQLYPGTLSFDDIPNLQPSRNMIERTTLLLQQCQNPLDDERVSRMARTFARVRFGSPASEFQLAEGDHLIIIPLEKSPFEFEKPEIVEAMAIWIKNGELIDYWNVQIDMMINNPDQVPFQYTTMLSQRYSILMSQTMFTKMVLDTSWGVAYADVLSELNLSINTLTTHQAGGSWSPFITVDWGWIPNPQSPQWTQNEQQLDFSGIIDSQFQITDGILLTDFFGGNDPLGIVNIDIDALALQIVNYLLGGQIDEVTELESELIAGKLENSVETTFQVFVHSPYGQLYDQTEIIPVSGTNEGS